MSRDWKKDMELIKIGESSDIPYCISEFKNMLPYYHQQYAAEKERADKAEASEQKLREAAEKCINIFWEVTISDEKSLSSICDILTDVLASYPKEETKPAVLEEGETE